MALLPHRRLDRYPHRALRLRTLVVVCLITITTYYALYVKGSVAPRIIDEYDMSLRFYVFVTVFANLVAAFTALVTGLADRVGRCVFVLWSTGLAAFATAVLIPATHSKTTFLLADVAQNMVLSTVLVAMPALVRDFAPQLSRATAMSMWNLGPILGSLIVSSVASTTLDAHPDWRFQLRVCGGVVFAAFLLALIGLRELSPALRAQLVVSAADVDAVEQRAEKGVTGLPPGAWKALLRPSILVPVVGISVFLFFYFTRISYWVIYFSTNFPATDGAQRFSLSEANGLSNWWWLSSAVTLLFIGLISDRLGVRKPLMLLGAVVSIAALSQFGSLATDGDFSRGHLIAIIVPAAVGGTMCSAMWITAYTQAIEAIDPALVATGIAIYNWVLRILVAGCLFLVVVTVSAAGTLVDDAPDVARLGELTAQVRSYNATRPTGWPEACRDAAVARAPSTQDCAWLSEHGPEAVADVDDVRSALGEGPDQWRRWWRICLLLQLLFVPTIWFLPGPWRRRRPLAG